MATQWILGKVSDALAPTVSSACSSAGTFAGGACNTVGNSINGVGQSINSGIRYYGDGAKDYGNAIMDWSKASGTRAQTAGNPLGLSSTSAGGKNKVTTPSIYRADPGPKKTSTKTSKATNVTTTAQPKKTVAAAKKPATAVTSKPKSSTAQKPIASPSTGTKLDVNKSIGASTKAKGSPRPGSTTIAKTKAPQSSKAATNPLGLGF